LLRLCQKTGNATGRSIVRREIIGQRLLFPTNRDGFLLFSCNDRFSASEVGTIRLLSAA
jgi:hypothetical protein